MALVLTFDPTIKTLEEPGYRQHISAWEATHGGQVGDPTQTRGIIADPTTGTLMLMPLQLSPHWLNSEGQGDSIIRKSALVTHPTDDTNGTVFEEFAFGNAENFFIYHSPIGFAGVPHAPGPPGSHPTVTGAPYGGNLSSGLTSISNENQIPVVRPTSETTETGSIANGRVIAYTRDPLPANAPIFFRFAWPDPRAVLQQSRYIVFVGQLAIEVIGNLVAVWTDVSTAGDRSSFQRIFAKPMFGAIDAGRDSSSASFGIFSSAESAAHDRSLLMIPYFRTRILLISTSGSGGISSAYSIPILREPVLAPEAIRNHATPGERYNWTITREDKAVVWGLLPSPGRWELQRVRYSDGPVTIQLPPIVLDYTPTQAATITMFNDEERGTDIGGVAATPPGYTMRFNTLDVCPPATTGDDDQSLSYGVTLTFTGEATHRWTPFFYGLSFTVAEKISNPLTSPFVVLDTGVPTFNIQTGIVAWGDRPGDGRMEVTIIDENPAYGAAGFYHRVGVPVQLSSSGTACFTGVTEPHEVTPWHATTRPRSLKVSAVDRWKILASTFLRPQGSWAGTGHITTVLAIARQAGIDTTTAETPTINDNNNTPLSWLNTSVPRTEEEAKLLRSVWEPKSDDTAASFILRIAELFSGWDVGFRGDGTFFYLPKDFFTATALRFFHTRAEAVAAGLPTNPLVRNPVEWEAKEPEANVVQVISAENSRGETLRSSLFVDFASIRNPNAVNFIGRWKPTVIVLGDVASCVELNRMARTEFDQLRRRKRMITFESDFVPTLKIGNVLEVGTYGLARLKKLKVQFEQERSAPTTYETERVEAGFGV